MHIEEFARRLRARETTVEQATNEAVQRAEAEQSRLNAFIRIMHAEAHQQARELDQELASGRDRGPLHGIPVTIKDILDIKGVATTAASNVREGYIAQRDCPAVAHLRQAGAVFIGKTNLHEFAFGTTNEDSAFGPARNPFDPSRSPGGSSGGSAAALAAGIGWPRSAPTPAADQNSGCRLRSGRFEADAR
jgi:aspartyl-tRNA(Asn)/glutamyl-tRNA(Gln) amidotransferase subunit A